MALKINNYWLKRRQQEAEAFQKRSEDELLKKLAKEYQRAAQQIADELETLYLKLLYESNQSGTAMVSHMYQYNRYYDALNFIQTRLEELGIKETEYFTKSLTNLYNANSKRIGEQFNLPFTAGTELDARKALNAVWAPDQMNWSQRIWKHEAELINKLSSTLVDAVSMGVNPDKLVKNVMEDFGVSFSQAQRLVVTESSYIMNQSALDRYEAAGVNEYIFLGDQSGACQECSDLNGTVFNMNDAAVGVNLPPIHPNCRCAILAKL